jgi:hypothetical protein
MDQTAMEAVNIVTCHASLIQVQPNQLAECIAVDIYRTLARPDDVEFLKPTEDAPQSIRDAINAIETFCADQVERVNGVELSIIRKFVAAHLAMTAAKTDFGQAIDYATQAAIDKRKTTRESN